MNTSPVLEPAEHILDFVSLTVEHTVMFDRIFPVGFCRDASCDASLGESLTEPVGVIAFVAEEFLGLRQGRQHQSRAFVVAHLAFAEQHDQRSPVAIAHGMQFRVQAAFRTPDTSGNSPFFRRLAAVRWAFKWVVSIISRRGLPALRVSSSKILLNTPRRLQRTNRL